MKLYRHYCLNGEIWDFYGLTPMLPEEIPCKCPQKVSCGREWEEVPLDMYPGGSPFTTIGERKEEEK